MRHRRVTKIRRGIDIIFLVSETNWMINSPNRIVYIIKWKPFSVFTFYSGLSRILLVQYEIAMFGFNMSKNLPMVAPVKKKQVVVKKTMFNNLPNT